MSRRWIKLYPEETFTGSTFIELNYKERYVWWGLLLMAGRSAKDGIVFKRWDTGFTHQQLAYELDCPLPVIKSALAKMTVKRYDEQLPKINILSNGIIEICNWKKYQSEYDRVKIYRNDTTKVTPKVTANNVDKYTIELEVEEDIDKEKEILKEKGFPQPVDNFKNKPNISKGKEKYNYFKGMEVERKHNKIKETEKAERNLILQAKNCYKVNYDLGNACSGKDMAICKLCIPNQLIFKADWDKVNNIPETYAQCENFIKRSCYQKDNGIEKYSYCKQCAKDDNWGSLKNIWGF